MMIDFGKVERYLEDRGFGFVTLTFAKMPPKEVFFHIKVVRRANPELAQALDSTKTPAGIYFWYEYRTTPKGQEVVAILDLNAIRQHAHHIAPFIKTIRASWIDVGRPLSESLRRATSDLLTSDEADELETSRAKLEADQKRRQEELQRPEAALLQAIDARRQAIADQERVKEEEFRQLVEEMSAFRYTHSREVSAHIVRHKLGHKYRHISGILQMELNGDVWNFNGGFPPNVYARLCEALRLGNQKSRAVPVAFTPYNDIIKGP